MAQQLARNAEIIRNMVTGVTDEQARWQPTPQDWSILEVVNHLYDEEREDFRTRIDFTLHRPGEDPPGIDPVGWVTERAYNQRNLAESIQNFLRERQQSVTWLTGLSEPDWAKSYKRADFAIRAGDLLAAWLAHDFLHLRQFTELHYAWVKQSTAPFSVAYAGDW
ncbi:DinB family protein [soil metagenome]